MSDQEKKEQEIMNQEMSFDEMETVAGGRCFDHHQNTGCASEFSEHSRLFRNPDGTPNCEATVEDGSWCSSNDACYGSNDVAYLGLQNCAKAWD